MIQAQREGTGTERGTMPTASSNSVLRANQTYRDRWQKCLTVLMEEEKRNLQGSHHIAPANPGPGNRASFSGRQCVTSHLVYATMSKQYQFKLVLLGQFLLSESLIPLRSFKVNQQLENLGTLYTILHVTRLTLHQPCPPFRQGPVR